MKKFTLDKPVNVYGADVLGRCGACLRFEPVPRTSDSDGLSPLLWSPGYEPEHRPEPMTPLAADYNARWRNINLTHSSGRKLHIAEHVSPLAFVLAGVRVFSPLRFPPYRMPGSVLNELRPHLVDTGELFSWKMPTRTVKWAYPETRNGFQAFTSITPHARPELMIDITISYRGLGTHSDTFDVGALGAEKLAIIMRTGAQGMYSKWLVWLARLLRWPHFNTVVWPDASSPEAAKWTLELFMQHRLTDILGSLALLTYDGKLPAARVKSVCSGHLADLSAVKAADCGEWKDIA